MAGRFIDFAALKRAVSLLQAAQLLDLELKRQGKPNEYRGECPVCGGGKRSLIITDGVAWHCMIAEEGGDVISLARHVLELDNMRDAAFELAERANFDGNSRTRTSGTSGTSTAKTVPESERERKRPRVRGGGEQSSPPSHRFDPDEYAAKLDYEHELLADAGADTAKMRELGIGYSSRGTHRGMIVIRVTDDAGEVSFIGVEGIHLPPNLKSNIVPFQKRA